MPNRLTLNSIDPGIFRVCAADTADGTQDRADIVAMGRTLFYEHSRRGTDAVRKAMNSVGTGAAELVTAQQYSEMNRVFQNDLMLYCAHKACEFTGEKAPETFEQFKRMGQKFGQDAMFLRVMQGVIVEIVTPILPRVYSEAVDVFADTVEVGFGETHAITVESGDIPVFQDSAWGASRSVPANRFYAKDITLNPQPKTAEIRMKWHQMVGNGTDFGAFFANIVAGMYAKTMALWNSVMAAAASDTTLVPSGVTYNFNSGNWVTLANKLAAANATRIGNLFATGNMVALSKVLPTQVTGSTNVNMDAAIATLLGADYTRAGYLGEYMGVRLLPLTDAIVPGTQFTTVNTVLDQTKIWMMAGRGRKPITIGYNRDTPISIEIRPEMTSSFELIFNLTIALDAVAVFASRVGLINIS